MEFLVIPGGERLCPAWVGRAPRRVPGVPASWSPPGPHQAACCRSEAWAVERLVSS